MNNRLPLLIALFILFGGVIASAQPRHPMTIEDVVALRRASDAQVSPDIRRTIFVVTAWDREADRFNSDLWLAATDFFQPAMRLTFNPKRDDHPRWSPDARRIAFLSERGAENATAQIYLLNLTGGEAQQLTSHQTAVQDFAWSPDGRFIAFIAEEPRKSDDKDKPKTKPPVVIDEDYRYAQLWVVNVETGETKQLTRGTRHLTGFDWSRDGAQIVFTARVTPKLADNLTTEIYLVPFNLKEAPVDTAQARQLTNRPGGKSQPRFSPDGQKIAFLATADGDLVAGPERIHVIPPAGGEPRVLARNFDGYIRTFRWASDSYRLVFSADVGVNSHIFTTDLSDKGLVPVTNGEGTNLLTSATYDGYQVIFIHENPMMASEVMTISARNPVFFQLTKLNPQVESFALGRVDAIKWKSNDSTEIEGLLIYPLGYENGRRYPLLTYIHGGPEGAYTRNFNASWSAFPQVYAGNGYAVFMPNFRGSSNYGAKFAQANKLTIGKVDYEDVLSGIDELVKRGIADENRLAVAGWSYGGYLSGWIIGHTNRFRCAAYGAGLSNAVSYWATADIQYSRERLHGGTPWENRKAYDELSPLSYLSQARTPVLIFHGEKDERVPLGQSLESFRTLKRTGVPVQLVVYPDQGHGLTVPSYQLDKMKREFAWIEKYLSVR
jgi:dipeptidyl aminopeptidase/acylaminoacyl peptidase